ncbi:MAG TPA: DUF4412 domain-containing protein [Sphingobacteriaceae bacterium]|nr:DUF4412 domain-containing protein [Sphingobacteriaceae bacterium]
MMKRKWNKSLKMMAVMGLLFALTPAHSDAQILRNITKRVTEKVEQEANRRAERKIDQAINKGFDEIETSFEEQLKASAGNDSAGTALLEQIMGGLSADIQVRDSYDFKVGITYDMIIQEQGQSESEKNVMSMWFADAPYVGSEAAQGGQSMFSVIDDGQIIMFNEKDMVYMGISSNTMDAIGRSAREAGAKVTEGEEGEEDLPVGSMRQLADENILGYSCKVYEFKTDDMTSKVWYTEALGVNMFEAYASSAAGLTRYMSSEVPKEARDFNGVLMKMESHDQDGSVMIMEATEVHKNGKTIKTSEYNRMGLN